MTALRDIALSVEEINNAIQLIDSNKVSDGNHIFQELYEHRIALFIALAQMLPNQAWKSRIHSDGTSLDGWFIAGINYLAGEQITYHLPDDKWEVLNVHELKKSPPFDGHTPKDVRERLYKL